MIDKFELESLPSRRIRDIVGENPETMPILAGFGLDLCCGGDHTLEAACLAHGLALTDVLSALEPILPADSKTVPEPQRA